MRIASLFLAFSLLSLTGWAQPDRWQQRVNYKMDIDMDVSTNQFTGKQQLDYWNNSPDTLYKLFYHLYFNAFQPGSMMDVRSRSIVDPDRRVGSRIEALKETEIGYHKIESLMQDGEALDYELIGTVVKVKLKNPIQPGATSTFDMAFNSQVPVQIRRSGRNNSEGIDYTMTQWYPKMAEYDRYGWHPDQYIGREFIAPYGTFDVTINIHKDYTIGGTGNLQNAEQLGYGYFDGKVEKQKGKMRQWHFTAENVHDFGWAADKDYVHTSVKVPNGPMVHFFYSSKTANIENWEKMPEYVIKYFQFMEEKFGKYPYAQFSLIQGGDGGRSAISWLDPDVYFAYVNQNLTRTQNAASSWQRSSEWFSSDMLNSGLVWNAPFRLHENTSDLNSADSIQFIAYPALKSLGFGNGNTDSFYNVMGRPQESAVFNASTFVIFAGGDTVRSDAQGNLTGDGTGMFNAANGEFYVNFTTAPSGQPWTKMGPS